MVFYSLVNSQISHNTAFCQKNRIQSQKTHKKCWYFVPLKTLCTMSHTHRHYQCQCLQRHCTVVLMKIHVLGHWMSFSWHKKQSQSRTTWPWRWRHHYLLKCWELLTQWQSVIFHHHYIFMKHNSANMWQQHDRTLQWTWSSRHSHLVYCLCIFWPHENLLQYEMSL